MIESEQKTVYRGGGRRWITLSGAANAEARALIKSRCECDHGDGVTPPEPCRLHDPEHYPKIKRRLARIYKAEFLRGRPQ